VAYKDKEKERATMRRYYQEHKEEIRAYHKKYNKEWYQKNREEIKARHRRYREENKEDILEYRQKLRQRALKLLGGKCSICGSKDDLCMHEKKANKHLTGTTGCLLALKYPERFRLLCKRHHGEVHKVMRETGFNF